MKWHARQEAMQLQNYHFGVYLESCDFIKYDSNPNQVLEDDRLDRQSFPALSPKDMMELIEFHINRLMKLEYIHEYFACWKSLAKCEFIKFDSDLSGIFNRIKCEEKWPEVSDKMLKVTLAEHVKLLCQLTNHNKATGGPVLDSKVPELFSTDLEEAIDGKYQAAILAFNKKDSQRRLKDYHDHGRFKHLVTKLAIQSRASGIGLLPKKRLEDCHAHERFNHPGTKRAIQSHASGVEFYLKSQKIQPMALLLKKLSELNYGSKPLSMYPLLSGLEYLPRGKAFPTYIRGLPVLMFGVVLAGLGMGREKMSR